MLGGCLENGHLGGSLKSASSSGSGGGARGTLFVDLHTLMPSTNAEPTVDNPNPTNASRNIAKLYSAQSEVAIEWASEYNKPTAGIESMRSWFVNQINIKNCPIIAYSEGTALQETGWYLDLTEYLERPNPYVEGNEHWKDLFYDWVWEDNSVVDANGRIVAIPLVLHAGTATAIYYNKSLVKSEPDSWQKLLDIKSTLEMNNIPYPYVPYTSEKTVGLNTWAIRFIISPGYAKNIMTTAGIDYDGNGKLSTKEKIRAVLEDKFNPLKNATAEEFYNAAKNYYRSLPGGWMNTTSEKYLNEWRAGNVGMVNQGIWFNSTEKSASHSFEYSLFPTPVLMHDDVNSPNAANLERKTLDEGFQSGVAMAFNIMKDGVKSDDDIEKAIDFLMYLSTPSSDAALCAENGTGFPSVKGAQIGSVFTEEIGWSDKTFTNIYDAVWPYGFTSYYTTLIDDAFGEWYRNIIPDSTFFALLNQYQKEGAQQMVNQMGITWDD